MSVNSPVSICPKHHSSLKSRIPTPAIFLIAAALLIVLLLGYVGLGPKGVGVHYLDAAEVIWRHLSFSHAAESDRFATADVIVWQLRLPRALAAVFIGALLGYAGVALQGLLMNPLADPYTVGVSAGAAVGAAFAEALGFGALLAGMGGVFSAFGVAILSVWVVYSLAKVGGRVSAHTFLLAGVVTGTFLWSLIPLLMVMANRSNDLARLMFYLIGNLQQCDWQRVTLLAPFVLIGALFLQIWSADLNLMTLGEESAAHLGVDIELMKRRILFLASLLTAAAVSAGGIIGFVGLVVPHVARRAVGPDHRLLLPLSALLGAILLLASDTVVRVWLNDMPVGVVTSLIGAPVFCVLLRRRRAVAW
jgi:iron complex transport system permease protein